LPDNEGEDKAKSEFTDDDVCRSLHLAVLVLRDGIFEQKSTSQSKPRLHGAGNDSKDSDESGEDGDETEEKDEEKEEEREVDTSVSGSEATRVMRLAFAINPTSGSPSCLPSGESFPTIGRRMFTLLFDGVASHFLSVQKLYILGIPS